MVVLCASRRRYNSVKPLLEEMVAQRVAQDFQIVEKVSSRPGACRHAGFHILLEGMFMGRGSFFALRSRYA